MEKKQLDQHVQAGEELSEGQVTDLEQRLLQEPDDLAARVQLLAYHKEKWSDHETSSRPLIDAMPSGFSSSIPSLQRLCMSR